MPSNTDEALAIFNALKPMIIQLIREETQSCIRAAKATCTTPADSVTAANQGKIGVTEAYGTEQFYPYRGTTRNTAQGESVWIWWYANDKSTGFAFEPPTVSSGQVLPEFGVDNEFFKQYDI